MPATQNLLVGQGRHAERATLLVKELYVPSGQSISRPSGQLVRMLQCCTTTLTVTEDQATMLARRTSNVWFTAVSQAKFQSTMADVTKMMGMRRPGARAPKQSLEG